MASQPLVATIRAPHTNEINVRSGPSTNTDILLKVKDGLAGLRVIGVQGDAETTQSNGKTYQWFLLQFPNMQGWVRDDLLTIEGDGTPFGYGLLPAKTYAFALTRAIPRQRTISSVLNQSRPQTNTPSPNPAPTPSTVPEPSAEDRIVRSAFNITAAFEGSGYGSYQTYDQGVISYGRFQFTLLSGSLAAVVSYFTTISNSLTAQALKKDYLPRLQQRDRTLRTDDRLRAIMLRAATEPEMQTAQNKIAFDSYWRVVYQLSIEPRYIQTSLAQAMCFDIGIQHGTHHNLFSRAEIELGVPIKSRLGSNGVREADFIYRVALIRQEILYSIATYQNLPGVRKRADFWLELVRSKDWNLDGDQNGYIVVNGRKVQVHNP